MTEPSQYRCAVKENARNEPWLLFEPSGGEELRELRGKVLGIVLRSGTTLPEARELAYQINRHMAGLSITSYLRLVNY